MEFLFDDEYAVFRFLDDDDCTHRWSDDLLPLFNWLSTPAPVDGHDAPDTVVLCALVRSLHTLAGGADLDERSPRLRALTTDHEKWMSHFRSVKGTDVDVSSGEIALLILWTEYAAGIAHSGGVAFSSMISFVRHLPRDHILCTETKKWEEVLKYLRSIQTHRTPTAGHIRVATHIADAFWRSQLESLADDAAWLVDQCADGSDIAREFVDFGPYTFVDDGDRARHWKRYYEPIDRCLRESRIDGYPNGTRIELMIAAVIHTLNGNQHALRDKHPKLGAIMSERGGWWRALGFESDDERISGELDPRVLAWVEWLAQDADYAELARAAVYVRTLERSHMLISQHSMPTWEHIANDGPVVTELFDGASSHRRSGVTEVAGAISRSDVEAAAATLERMSNESGARIFRPSAAAVLANGSGDQRGPPRIPRLWSEKPGLAVEKINDAIATWIDEYDVDEAQLRAQMVEYATRRTDSIEVGRPRKRRKTGDRVSGELRELDHLGKLRPELMIMYVAVFDNDLENRLSALARDIGRSHVMYRTLAMYMTTGSYAGRKNTEPWFERGRIEKAAENIDLLSQSQSVLVDIEEFEGLIGPDIPVNTVTARQWSKFAQDWADGIIRHLLGNIVADGVYYGNVNKILRTGAKYWIYYDAARLHTDRSYVEVAAQTSDLTSHRATVDVASVGGDDSNVVFPYTFSDRSVVLNTDVPQLWEAYISAPDTVDVIPHPRMFAGAPTLSEIGLRVSRFRDWKSGAPIYDIDPEWLFVSWRAHASSLSVTVPSALQAGAWNNVSIVSDIWDKLSSIETYTRGIMNMRGDLDDLIVHLGGVIGTAVQPSPTDTLALTLERDTARVNAGALLLQMEPFLDDIDRIGNRILGKETIGDYFVVVNIANLRLKNAFDRGEWEKILGDNVELDIDMIGLEREIRSLGDLHQNGIDTLLELAEIADLLTDTPHTEQVGRPRSPSLRGMPGFGEKGISVLTEGIGPFVTDALDINWDFLRDYEGLPSTSKYVPISRNIFTIKLRVIDRPSVRAMKETGALIPMPTEVVMTPGLGNIIDLAAELDGVWPDITQIPREVIVDGTSPRIIPTTVSAEIVQLTISNYRWPIAKSALSDFKRIRSLTHREAVPVILAEQAEGQRLREALPNVFTADATLEPQFRQSAIRSSNLPDLEVFDSNLVEVSQLKVRADSLFVDAHSLREIYVKTFDLPSALRTDRIMIQPGIFSTSADETLRALSISARERRTTYIFPIKPETLYLSRLSSLTTLNIDNLSTTFTPRAFLRSFRTLRNVVLTNPVMGGNATPAGGWMRTGQRLVGMRVLWVELQNADYELSWFRGAAFAPNLTELVIRTIHRRADDDLGSGKLPPVFGSKDMWRKLDVFVYETPRFQLEREQLANMVRRMPDLKTLALIVTQPSVSPANARIAKLWELSRKRSALIVDGSMVDNYTGNPRIRHLAHVVGPDPDRSVVHSLGVTITDSELESVEVFHFGPPLAVPLDRRTGNMKALKRMTIYMQSGVPLSDPRFGETADRAEINITALAPGGDGVILENFLRDSNIYNRFDFVK